MEKRIKIKDGWVFKGIENGEIILEKEYEYPKTWSDCLKDKEFANTLEFLDVNSSVHGLAPYIRTIDPLDVAIQSSWNLLPEGYGAKMLALSRLLVCRDAYRKIEGFDGDKDKLVFAIKHIYSEANKKRLLCLSKVSTRDGSLTISFSKLKTAEEFMKNFSGLIKEAGDLVL